MHTDNVSYLSDGFEEVNGMQLVDEKVFLNDHLKERILMRLLAQHHIKLTSQLKELGEGGDLEKLDSIGIIDKNINILDLLNRSFQFVNDMAALKYDERIGMKVKTITINPDNSRTVQEIEDIGNFEDYEPIVFPYIASHIEYVFNEILKNSTRAHAENNVNEPVEALVVVNKPDLTSPDPQLYKLEVRVSDKGKGVKPEIIDKLFEYSFTTFDDQTEDDDYKTLNSGSQSANIIAGMGYGLPLSLTYNKLFHGDIRLKSIYGDGTNVYLSWTGIDAKKLIE
ncbi:unnamed protein product [Ambrosiozyma monospora]|uniref:Protein-serine/threonine kinase n=1 Tax=Ambrosiozyma monospora TaxID=43982 RepID=A0A9W6T1W6_AMBMO|nr:unnamed protein product [Ambrosiozyma monospora]